MFSFCIFILQFRISYKLSENIVENEANLLITSDKDHCQTCKNINGVDTTALDKSNGYVLYTSDNENEKGEIIIIGADEDGVFNGVMTLKQIFEQGIDGTFAQVNIADYPNIIQRGVIEGFYGYPWSFEARVDMIRDMSDFKMNTYMYAPKDDPYHRDKWRELYPEKEAKEIRELVETGKEENVDFAVIAVASGHGIRELFKSEGVNRIISGGQTMNPSTKDIMDAITNSGAKKAIILPNNGNIIMAAKQAAEVSEIPVGIVPTKTISQGLTAMLSFDPDASVEENVIMDVPTVGDEAYICSALESAGLGDKVKSFEDGIHSVLSKEFNSHGEILSGGESQKIAIARLYARKYEIAVLDEPSSSLDPLAEKDMYEKLLSATEGKTVIYISHNLSSARLSDRILLFQEGKIIEEGTHCELMALNGKYSEMFRLQAAGYVSGEESKDETQY